MIAALAVTTAGNVFALAQPVLTLTAKLTTEGGAEPVLTLAAKLTTEGGGSIPLQCGVGCTAGANSKCQLVDGGATMGVGGEGGSS